LRLSFERSGGFAALTMSAIVDENDLAPDEAQKLRQLVGEADFFNLPEKIMGRSPRPDRFQYQLRLEESGREHAVTVSEEALSPKLKALVQWLTEKAREARRG
jgi:hypothetical protein